MYRVCVCVRACVRACVCVCVCVRERVIMMNSIKTIKKKNNKTNKKEACTMIEMLSNSGVQVVELQK